MDSTFSSYQDIVFSKLKSHFITFLFSPLAYVLFNDKTAIKEQIKLIKTPRLLVIHSRDDKVIPYNFGAQIYQEYSGQKDFWEIFGSPHIGIYHNAHKHYRQKFLDFLKGL